jgi:hypothetical protein
MVEMPKTLGEAAVTGYPLPAMKSTHSTPCIAFPRA